MCELFKTRIVANVEECRLEAELRPASIPDEEEPWAMVYELDYGWCFELPYERNESLFPFAEALEALEDAADVLETYPNHIGLDPPRGLEATEMRKWLLATERTS
ncbi:MAG: hypothetical protein R2991_06965 [Thermoanaerobaculia bacterium]